MTNILNIYFWPRLPIADRCCCKKKVPDFKTLENCKQFNDDCKLHFGLYNKKRLPWNSTLFLREDSMISKGYSNRAFIITMSKFSAPCLGVVSNILNHPFCTTFIVHYETCVIATGLKYCILLCSKIIKAPNNV